jgi:hypothetical protein
MQAIEAYCPFPILTWRVLTDKSLLMSLDAFTSGQVILDNGGVFGQEFGDARHENMLVFN